MTLSTPDARLRSLRDPLVRIVVALPDGDGDAIAQLHAEGFYVERCAPDAAEAHATRLAADAIVVDVDLPGALAAVARIRRSDAVVSTVPIVLVGQPRGALQTSLDAVEAGGDAYLPRPLSPPDLTYRLHTLLELPGSEPLRSEPPPRRATLPVSLAPPPTSASAPAGPLGSSGLSTSLEAVLLAASARAGGSEVDLALPSLGDDSVDDLIPPELLEPLDAPLDALGDDAMSLGGQLTPPPYGHTLSGSRRTQSGRGYTGAGARSVAPTPTITPLAVGGETRLAGAQARYGAGVVLGAASRSRASGLLVLRARGDEYALSLTAGHLLALRSSRSDHEAGALLARLGCIPREAARFAAVPLDAGLRGAARVAARGYLAPEALSAALDRAAREVTFDLLALPEVEWEMRPLETALEIPLSPRALDALLLLGARARIEPAEAIAALGGEGAVVSLKAEPAALAALPLTRNERDAAAAARAATVATLADAHGAEVFPALLALAWLGCVRVEGGVETGVVAPAPGPALAQERTRVRALVEGAQGRDFFALLGVSEWATRGASLDALDARRSELAGLRARHPDVPALELVVDALNELGALLEDPPAWSRYATALRVRSS